MGNKNSNPIKRFEDVDSKNIEEKLNKEYEEFKKNEMKYIDNTRLVIPAHNRRKVIDSNFLKEHRPPKKLSKLIQITRSLEGQIDKLMIEKNKNGYRSLIFVIPYIPPGFGKVDDMEELRSELIYQLSKRKGIRCYVDKDSKHKFKIRW